jgi:hypothetical protein
MKSKISRILMFTIIAFAFCIACDEIDEPVTVVNEQYIIEGLLDENYVMDSVMVTRKQVLLEDFTGHKCVNCPEAGLAAHELAKDLNYKLIIYSVHAGYYAEPDETGNYTADFRCETGETLYNDFQAYANPIALIDRVEYSGSVLVGAGNWEAAVMQEIEKENIIDLKLQNYYFPDLNKIQLFVFSKFHSATSDKYKLVVYLVEDGIVSPQRNNNPGIGDSPDWLDYKHHNILRTSINSTYGGEFSTGGNVETGKEYTSQFIYPKEGTFNPEWVISNCKIIAYIYNDATKEILQVAELGIKTSK